MILFYFYIPSANIKYLEIYVYIIHTHAILSIYYAKEDKERHIMVMGWEN